MLPHIARHRIPAVAHRLQHARGLTSTAAISSTTASRTLENPSNQSIRTQISQASISELKSQLSTRNLPTKGSKPELIDRLSKSLSGSAAPLRAAVANMIKHTEPEAQAEYGAGNTGAEGGSNSGANEARAPRARAAKHQHSHPEDVPDMPDPSDLVPKEKEPPIRVPLTPDNKFARYHRHEIVPEVAKPLKPQVMTVLPDATQVLDERAGDLAKILEQISVEVKAHREQIQWTDGGLKETKETVRAVMAGGTQDTTAKDSDSTLRMIGRFPIDLAKDMIEDVMSAGEQFAEQEKREGEQKKEREERGEDMGAQVLTDNEKTVMYTIGGLSAAWYLLGY